MKKITLLIVVLMWVVVSNNSYAQVAPACVKSTAAILLNNNTQSAFTRTDLTGNTAPTTGNATFLFSGTPCAGSYSSDANFLGGAGNPGSATSGTYEIPFTIEFTSLNGGVKRFLMMFITDGDIADNNDKITLFIIVQDEKGTPHMWNIGDDIFEYEVK